MNESITFTVPLWTLISPTTKSLLRVTVDDQHETTPFFTTLEAAEYFAEEQQDEVWVPLYLPTENEAIEVARRVMAEKVTYASINPKLGRKFFLLPLPIFIQGLEDDLRKRQERSNSGDDAKPQSE